MGGGRGWRVGPEEERRGRNRQHGRMARRNGTLLDAARLIEGSAQAVWLIVHNRKGELDTIKRDPEGAVTTLAEIVHPARRRDELAQIDPTAESHGAQAFLKRQPYIVRP